MSTNHTILIVDDEQKILELLTRVVKRAGYTPTTASQGKAAIEQIEQLQPEVALIDLVLGDMSGLEVMRKIRACSSETECILMTGFATKDSAIEAINAGAYGYIEKPFDIEQLMFMVRRALEKRDREEELRKARDQLEIRVDERTAELSEANRQLQAQFAERMRVEDALRDAAQEWRATFDAITDGLCMLDVEARVVRCNKAMTRLLGKPFHEIIGHKSQDLVEEIPEQEEDDLPLRIDGTLQRATTLTQLRDRWFDVSSDPLRGDQGILIGAIQIFSDITERKYAEEALLAERASLARRVEERTAELSAANAELARAVRLKDEFLATMSHELRTPLNAILGMSEALQEEVFGSLNEKQLQSLRRIEESGRHLLSLINDILDVSKIEAGKAELDMGIVSIDSVCRASLGLVKQTAQKKRIAVSSSIDNRVDSLQADERRLKQILVNLLGNAVKFTPEGGEIGLDVVADPDQEVVRLTVWDTGIGIEKEAMRDLFKPFVQLDAKLSREYGGTGLGLSLAQRLAALHGGGISVESEVGEGSRFTVVLPCKMFRVGEETESTGPAGSSANGVSVALSDKEGLILLAEDSEVNIETIAGYLQARGYTVIVARDGAEAVERTIEKQPDVVLMDIQMPRMDGLEATQRIRNADHKARNVPIVALTALAMPGDRERCLEAGATEYLSKPVSLHGLVEVIEKLRDSQISAPSGP